MFTNAKTPCGACNVLILSKSALFTSNNFIFEGKLGSKGLYSGR